MHRRPLGNTGLSVTPICFGASGLGDMPDTYGYAVDEDRARATLRAIFDSPVNCLDTARIYGFGRSEARIGDAIRERGGLPEGFVISSKVDRDFETGRFDAARVRQSAEQSLEALGLDTIPLLHLHDPEHARDLQEITAEGGALDELFKLKAEGITQAVGLAMGRLDIMEPLLRERPFDALISHNRFTLMNRAADALFSYAQEAGIAVLNAAPYAGGVLAKGTAEMPRVTYQEADEAALAPAKRIEAVCAGHGVSPGAAALQFSMNDPRVLSTVIGVTKPERVAQTLDWARAAIPPAVAAELAALPYETGDPEANRVYRPG
ncbi:aldo/keto reductase [Psychromarinibacter sp. C21-152]|uniref:Aldo/keto reductase n=1 Tax=Psychromarinibacter sediminicola TaxID=3033385 RepID=A0AAE3NWR9_9RHOB|nr:aldo/keto reductase [Psychromarinibacter sediminicola]MDF0603436.1 aldo/keto reductase [Psychromarinibacter sediminicola]